MLSGGQRKRVGLVQVLIRDPKILLMDEPFGPLDAQTRQIMGNLLLDLWNADRKAVLFVTHDLEEAIALSDRVVIMSAGPAARIIGDWKVALPRPRDIAEIKVERAFHDLHREIWANAEGRGAQGLRPDRRRMTSRCIACLDIASDGVHSAAMGAGAHNGGNIMLIKRTLCWLAALPWPLPGALTAPARRASSRSPRRRSRTASAWRPRWPATTSRIRIASAKTYRPRCPGRILRRAPRAMRC